MCRRRARASGEGVEREEERGAKGGKRGGELKGGESKGRGRSERGEWEEGNGEERMGGGCMCYKCRSGGGGVWGVAGGKRNGEGGRQGGLLGVAGKKGGSWRESPTLGYVGEGWGEVGGREWGWRREQREGEIGAGKREETDW